MYPITQSVIAHRGASAYAPENTFSAFDKAMALGCRYVEFDVMLSADGEPFVIHDEKLSRTTNGTGDVGLVSAEYLSTLDAGLWFNKQFRSEKIPRFQDVIQWLTFTGVQANVEIKPYNGMGEETASTVLAYINRYWPANKPLPLVSCFDRKVLSLCRSLMPELPLGFLMHTWDESWEVYARELNCASIHVHHSLLNTVRAKAIKAAGYTLFVYTVDRRRLAKKYLAMGADAVFSNYADLLS